MPTGDDITRYQNMTAQRKSNRATHMKDRAPHTGVLVDTEQ